MNIAANQFTGHEDNRFRRVHFIGIGGAGMSGIALVLHQRGYIVTGSDLKTSRFVRSLTREGIEVQIGQVAQNIDDARPDIVVTSTAISETNAELARARELGVEVWPRARMLAELARGRTTIAVAGTHGKTTTSAMLAETLDRMGCDPTFLIGGTIGAFETNGRNGEGAYFACEADESDGSFLYLDPTVAIITNIEADHLDHYGSLEEIKDIFLEFVADIPENGSIVACADEPGLIDLLRRSGKPVVSYGFDQNADIRCTVEKREQAKGVESLANAFIVNQKDGAQAKAILRKNPGAHNVANATSVIAACVALGLDLEDAAAAVSEFGGVRRRFDLVGYAFSSDNQEEITIIDDYAHHPTEIRATLEAASGLGFKRIHVIFQPHRYSRTRALFEDFTSSFADADMITILDVYAAGEAPIPGVTSAILARAIQEDMPKATVEHIASRDIVEYVRTTAQPGDLIITMGAGDVTGVGLNVLESYEEQGEDVKVVRR